MLEEIVKHRLPKVVTTKTNYNIRTVNTGYTIRENSIEVFEEIEEKRVISSTSNKASSFSRAPEDTKFLFWLTFLHSLT